MKHLLLLVLTELKIVWGTSQEKCFACEKHIYQYSLDFFSHHNAEIMKQTHAVEVKKYNCSIIRHNYTAVFLSKQGQEASECLEDTKLEFMQFMP